MANLLSRFGALQYSSEIRPVFLSHVSRYIALPVVPTSVPESINSEEAVPPQCQESDPEQQQNLAGDPQSVSGIRQEIREEILRRWNQKPKVDMSREWLKYAIHD